jgi:PPOX class probable F420-dependent enzyme
MAALKIPDSHLDLFTKPVHGVLATLMPDGQPQSSMIWTDYDGEYVLVNTTLERRKTQNMRRSPCVTILVIDPQNGSRWIEVRGKVVEITTDGAEAHADKLTQRYKGKPHFYGDVYAPTRKWLETRVIVKIEPVRISMNAVFG